MTKRRLAPRVHVQVTEENIRDSVRRSSSHCMNAEAVKAAYPNAKRISVDVQTIRFSDYELGLRFTFLTPRSVQKSIIDFDQGNVPDPFGYVLSNGQVTNSGARRASIAKPRSGERLLTVPEFADLANVPLRNIYRRLSRGTLPSVKEDGIDKIPYSQLEVFSRDKKRVHPEQGGRVSPVIGGRTPPISGISQRRAFGLRAMDR